MKSVEARGKTREEAIQNALRQLGVELYEVDKIEILDEGSRGLFGFGAREASVRLTCQHLHDTPARAESGADRDRDRGRRGGRGRGGGFVALDAVRQAQTVDLADHGVAGDAAQLLGDLAGRLAFGPHAFQCLDAFVGPGHGLLLGGWRACTSRAARF